MSRMDLPVNVAGAAGKVLKTGVAGNHHRTGKEAPDQNAPEAEKPVSADPERGYSTAADGGGKA